MPSTSSELAATERHLERLRDLKRIHSHICSVAYPVLDAAGQLETYRHEASEPAAIAASITNPVTR